MTTKNKGLMFALTSLLFVFLFTNSVYAFYPCDWDTYGGELSLMQNSQYYEECRSVFGTANVTNISYSAGQNYGDTKTAFQPLVAGLGDENRPLLIYPNGNYLEILDGDLNLNNEIFIGLNAVSQIDIGDLDGDGSVNDIAGIFKVNATYFSFRVYAYNKTNLQVTLENELNFSDTRTDFGSNGLRCEGGTGGNYGTCYTLLYANNGTAYNMDFYKFYGNGSYVGYSAGYSSSYPKEPLSYTDWDNDGTNEFMYWTLDKVVVFNGDNGNVENEYGGKITMAKFISPLTAREPTFFEELFGIIATSQRLVISDRSNSFGGCAGFTYKSARIYSVKSDNSVAWTKCIGSNTPTGEPYYYGFAIGDYNGDLKDDIWLLKGQAVASAYLNFDIYKGDVGTQLYTSGGISPSGANSIYPSVEVKLFRADEDDTLDLMASIGALQIWSPAKDTTLYSNSYGAIQNCIPADLDYDGLQDVICASTSQVTARFTNSNNSLPSLDTIAYSPSTSISVGQSVTALISATDSESDIIRYSSKCSDSLNQTAWDGSNVKSCTYSDVGIYNFKIYVSDIFHDYNGGEYNYYIQSISVTNTGLSCNNNNICEDEETNANCPTDCLSPSVNYTTTAGGMPISTQLVDLTGNTETGFLPEIYYGTLGFLSNVLPALIPIVFLVIILMIIMGLGLAIKNVLNK